MSNFVAAKAIAGAAAIHDVITAIATRATIADRSTVTITAAIPLLVIIRFTITAIVHACLSNHCLYLPWLISTLSDQSGGSTSQDFLCLHSLATITIAKLIIMLT